MENASRPPPSVQREEGVGRITEERWRENLETTIPRSHRRVRPRIAIYLIAQSSVVVNPFGN
jgi:hypothetical protein